jgi:hypothetical protein
VNGAFLEKEGKFLAVYGDPSGKHLPVDTVLLAEARRDVTWAARGLAQGGAKVVAPEKEDGTLAHPEKFWAELREKRFHDYAQQSTKVPVEPIPVSRTVKEGDTINWEGLSIRVFDTPGYTARRGKLCGRTWWQEGCLTGDLIRDDGKLQDLFSLQMPSRPRRSDGYHGWAGRLGELMVSLDRIGAEKPDLLVPLRGPVIRDPSVCQSPVCRIASARSMQTTSR